MQTYVAMLGALHGWRTCTAQQLAALVGDKRLRRPLSRPAALAYNAGLTEMAGPPRVATKQAVETIALYRPRAGAAFERFKDQLTYAERLGITGGSPWHGGGQNDRHNVLALELGLRLAEYAPIGTVLGETFSTINLLAGDGAGGPTLPPGATADLTVIRKDGMRIAVELTATTSKSMGEKVDRWAQALERAYFPTTGLTVLFLVAPSPSAPDGRDDDVRQAVYRAIGDACRRHPGFRDNLTRHRIGVATWREWFPGPHSVTPAFFAMRADRVVGTGRHRGEVTWESVDFLVPQSVPFDLSAYKERGVIPAERESMLAVVDNVGLLGQTPYWLRESSRPESVMNMLLAAHGLERIPDFYSRRKSPDGRTSEDVRQEVKVADMPRMRGLGPKYQSS